jgi:hypothetical protein
MTIGNLAAQVGALVHVCTCAHPWIPHFLRPLLLPFSPRLSLILTASSLPITLPPLTPLSPSSPQPSDLVAPLATLDVVSALLALAGVPAAAAAAAAAAAPVVGGSGCEALRGTAASAASRLVRACPPLAAQVWDRAYRREKQRGIRRAGSTDSGDRGARRG